MSGSSIGKKHSMWSILASFYFTAGCLRWTTKCRALPEILSFFGALPVIGELFTTVNYSAYLRSGKHSNATTTIIVDPSSFISRLHSVCQPVSEQRFKVRELSFPPAHQKLVHLEMVLRLMQSTHRTVPSIVCVYRDRNITRATHFQSWLQ
jgi:hypothetical protein